MNIKQLTKIERAKMPKKIPTLLRIKIGKALLVYASLPLMSAWAYIFAFPMAMAISPTVWIKGRINKYKGNGDLRL